MEVLRIRVSLPCSLALNWRHFRFFTLCFLCTFKLFKTIIDPAYCKIRAAEIYRQTKVVYGKNLTIDGMVRNWIGKFNERWTNAHDVARSGRPSVVNDDLVRKIYEKIHVKQTI